MITLQIPPGFNMYLVINACVTALNLENFSHHYLHNRSTLEIVVFGYTDANSLINILPKHGIFPQKTWCIHHACMCHNTRGDSSVSILTTGNDDQGIVVQFLATERDFFSSQKCTMWLLEQHSLFQWILVAVILG
jgi:hypothetical protein